MNFLKDNKPVLLLRIDVAVTLLFCIFWLWFGYQYGFRNMPDSWYRGILGKSILEGHSYFINFKQGYLYEFGAFHQDAAHPPFIPILMALCFSMFGNKIIFANLISCISAGLLIFPLIRISRELCKTSLIGYLIYFSVVLIDKSGFLLETLHGLSIPTSLFLVFLYLYFYLLTWENNKKIYPVIAGILLGCAALTRFDTLSVCLLIIAWHIFLTLFFFLKGDNHAAKKILLFTITSFLIVSPWLVRNQIIFNSPLFTHLTPTIWTDNPLEYWEYHEEIPFPSAKLYFEKHTLTDFLTKELKGFGNVYRAIGSDILSSSLWMVLSFFSLIFLLLLNFRNRGKFLFYITIFLLGFGYLVPLATIAYTDLRYMLPLIFLLVFLCFTAFYNLASLLQDKLFSSKKSLPISLSIGEKNLISFQVFPVFNMIAALILCFVTYKMQEDFWKNHLKRYLINTYEYEDKKLKNDPTIAKLKEKLNKNDIILGHITEVQRLNFATGLTFVETPENLNNLDDPYQFFKKYHINYSLVDINDVLPKKYIQSMETVGNSLLYKINLETSSDSAKTYTITTSIPHSDKSIQESIQQGKKEKKIFIDISHGGLEPNFKVLLRSWGYYPISPQSGFQNNKEKLFRAGLLIISYKIGGGEFSKEEIETIKQYIASGGSLFLLCPVWVWNAYDHKPLEINPYHQIGKFYNLLLVEEYPKGKLISTKNVITPNVQIESQDWWGSSSRIITLDKKNISLIEDPDKKSFGMAAILGKSKLVLIGQNFLSKPVSYQKDMNLKTYTVKLLDWLIKN